MGRKQELSQTLSSHVMILRMEKYSERQIASRLGVHPSTVHRTISRFNYLGSYSSINRCGRPPVTTQRDDAIIRRCVIKNPMISARQILGELPGDCNTSMRTIQRRLTHKFNLAAYRPAQKPCLSKKNIADRLAFCHRYKDWTSADWHKVMFADEAGVQQFSCNHPYVHRPTNQRYHSRFTISSVKHSPSVMIWSAISSTGQGGIWFMPAGTYINSTVYVDILSHHLLPYMADHNCTHLLHDRAPCHSAKIVQKWLMEHNIPVVDGWPGSSPDLNPIENCWTQLKKKVSAKKPSSVTDLKQKIQEVWSTEISPAYCCSLVDSMPVRIAAVVKAKGLHTKY